MDHGMFERAATFFGEVQGVICDALEALAVDGGSFGTDTWVREGGGGGVSRVLEGGAVFEKAGVNWSSVEGELGEDFAGQIPGGGTAFRATGVSLVIHPRSPMIPTTHANFRYLEKGDRSWFGGGADLTPYYLFREDAEHFHRTLEEPCARHPAVASYDRFKAWCDTYFFLAHRGETRGVGGVFFDYLDGDPEAVFAFQRDIASSFLAAYVPIVERRRAEPFGDAERDWQLYRRGRYVEFNLLHDRGTTFGLRTGGRVESILMSLPPLVSWQYCRVAPPGSREAELLAHLRPVDWLDRRPTPDLVGPP